MLPEEGLRQLHDTIQGLVDLPPEQWEAARSNLTTRDFEPGRYLVHAGTPVQSFFYLYQGLVRLFYVTEEGKEFNKSFRQEGDFVGVFSLDEETGGSLFTIQALELSKTVVLLSLPKNPSALDFLNILCQLAD